MLNRDCRVSPALRGGIASSGSQHGVVLLIALIILIALTLGGLALVRSVGTTNLISGNLAFQQSATRSAEAGTETAISAFLQTKSPDYLWTDHPTEGYVASTPAGVWTAAGDTAGTPAPANWDAYWTQVVDPNLAAGVGCAGPGRVCKMAQDAAGNTVSYTIQRLCQAAGDPGQSMVSGCARGSQPPSREGSGWGADDPGLNRPTQYFYRITTRVTGPRNTVSYIQTIVAI